MSQNILHNPIESIHLRLLDQELNVFVLIDVNSNPDLRRELFNRNDNPIYHCLFHGTILQEFRDRAPYLVQIELNQYQYIRYLLKEAAENIMLIFSAHEIDTLFQHWQSLLTVYGLDGDVALYKLYTPQILGPYLKACKPHEQTQLLAYTKELYLSNELDEWEVVYKTEPDTLLSAPELKTCHRELKTAWWHLKEEHLIYLQHITEESLISNMENYLTEYHLDLLIPYKDRDIEKMIRHGIRRGRYYGINTRRDFAFYLGMMFEVAPNFDEHPRVQKWLYRWDKNIEVGHMADDLPGQIWIEAHQQYDDNAWHKMQHDYHYIQPESLSQLSPEHALEIKPDLSGIMAG